MVKVPAGKVDAFVSAPPSETVAMVFFGPDSGLATDRAAAALRSYLGPRPDPMAVLDLRGPDLKSDPARLSDEAYSPSLLGGRRVIRVTEPTEIIATALGTIAERPPGDVMILVVAGDLRPGSALRKAAEGSGKAIAAIGCYPLDARAMAGFIVNLGRDNGLAIQSEALTALCDAVGSDRVVARRQIEKLALYLDAPRPAQNPGDSTATPITVSTDDVQACVGDFADRSLDDLAMAVCEGSISAVGRAYRTCLDQGATTVGILRAVQRHLMRLVPAVDAKENGLAPSRAIGEIKPPVFWKHKDRVTAQIARWHSDPLRSALDRLLEAEVQCKTTGIPDVSVCERALFQIARLSGRQTAGAAKR